MYTWCPNSKSACTTLIKPQPKTGFFMYSSKDNKKIVNDIKKIFEEYGFNLIDAMEYKSSKDVYCRICQGILSTAFSVALITNNTPKPSTENIYLEIGLSKAFGKEVIILTNERGIIASDLNGKGVFPFKNTLDIKKVINDWIKEIKTDIDTWNTFAGIMVELNKDYESSFELSKKAIMYGDFDEPLKNIRNNFPQKYKNNLPFSKRFHDDVNEFMIHLDSIKK